MFNSSAPSGISKRKVESLIADAVGDVTLPGKTSWVFGPTIDLAGANAVDFLGVPADANEIELTVRRASGNYQYASSVGMGIQVFNSSGNLLSSSYRVFMNSIAGTAISSANSASASSCGIADLMGPNDFVSGRVNLFRSAEAEWEGFSRMRNPVSRHYIAGCETPAVGAGITGVRLIIGLGNFDFGTARLAWRY